MLPRPTRLDPAGYYACLGVEPASTRASIVAAFRAKARLLHPDVPGTGDAAAFVAVKQAYDVLSDREQKASYDRAAREAEDRIEPEEIIVDPALYRPRPQAQAQAAPVPPQRLSRPWIVGLAGLGLFLCLSVFQVARHLMSTSPPAATGIRPNAATVEPLSPSAHREVLYGPAPVRLAGNPNFYVTPAGTPTTLWHFAPGRNELVPLGQLPPFSSVQAVRLVRQTGMLEVLVNDHGTGFISIDRLTAGNAQAARAAYCGYNAGPTPVDGELLERHEHGRFTLAVENRAVQPAVVKLRDAAGTVVVAAFLSPGSHADLEDLPEGVYRPEFAVGELWSRACNTFAAGMRARRIQAQVRVPGNALVVAVDGTGPEAVEITDQAFERE